MARGGKREGASGANYINRSDLRATQPIQTVPGQPYGEATAQANAQREIPLANGGAQSVAPGAQAPGAPPTPQVSVGSLGSMFGPSNNPDQPVTAGAASGPGAGPEALQGPQALNISSSSAMLRTLAQASGSSDLAVLAQHAASLGQ